MSKNIESLLRLRRNVEEGKWDERVKKDALLLAEKDPELLEAYVAKLLEDDEKIITAYCILQDVLIPKSPSLTNHSYLATIHVLEDELEAALETIARAKNIVKNSDERSSVRQMEASIYRQMGDYEAAAVCAGEDFFKEPNLNLGIIIAGDYMDARLYERAEEFLLSIMKIWPENPAIYSLSGHACLLQGKIAEAEQYAQEAKKMGVERIEGGYIDYHCLLAKICFAQGKNGEAKREMKLAAGFGGKEVKNRILEFKALLDVANGLRKGKMTVVIGGGSEISYLQ